MPANIPIIIPAMGPIHPTIDGVINNPHSEPATKFKIFEIFILLLDAACAHDNINHVAVLDNTVITVTVIELVVIPSIMMAEPML